MAAVCSLIAFMVAGVVVYFIALFLVGVSRGNAGRPTRGEKVAAAVITFVVLLAVAIVMDRNDD
jgi:uncharacterized membrane protein YidH (DUF202 family)